MYKVTNHKAFAHFNYESEETDLVELGQIMYKHSVDEDGKEEHEIGVVLQTFSDGEFRTDMWGNGCFSEEIRLATYEQIEKYRPELLSSYQVEPIMAALTQ